MHYKTYMKDNKELLMIMLLIITIIVLVLQY